LPCESTPSKYCCLRWLSPPSKEEIRQYRNRSRQDPLNHPIKLNNKVTALEGAVGSADTRPTDSSYQVFEELSSRLDAQLTALDGIAKSDMAAFDSRDE
jgi:hypothetical protein